MSSKRPVAPEGMSRSPEPTTQLVVPGQEVPTGEGRQRGDILGLLWCLLGSIFVTLAPVVANVLVGFGATIAMGDGDRRRVLATSLAALAAGGVATYAVLGLHDVPMTLATIACACVLAGAVVTEHLSSALVVALAAGVTCLTMGADIVSTSLQGVSLTKVYADVIDAAVEQSLGQNLDSLDLSGTTELLEARDSVLAYWPTLYFAVGVATVVCSLAGAWLGDRTSRARLQPGMISRFDVPLWVALLFAAGVAAELLGPRLPAWQDESALVGANVVMCARIVLAQQGLSVLQWVMRKRQSAPPTRTLVVMLGLWLELSFALMSVVGLLDVAVNFRHLRRNRGDLVLGPARER